MALSKLAVAMQKKNIRFDVVILQGSFTSSARYAQIGGVQHDRGQLIRVYRLVGRSMTGSRVDLSSN